VVRPLPVGEPAWSDHPGFDLASHLTVLDGPHSEAQLREARDEFLSQPLDRARPLWQILVVPELEGGRAAVAGKVHHAMVDGIAAVEMGMLLFDSSPGEAAAAPERRPGSPAGEPASEHAADVVPWRPEPSASGLRLTVDAIADTALDQFRAARRVAALGLAPGRTATIAQTMRRAALSIAEEALSPASPSYLNRRLGPARTLVTADLSLPRLHALKHRLDVKLNDVVLALAAGAMRRFAAIAGEEPRPLRTMVPVNVRREGEGGGNRIAFAFVDLPCEEPSPLRRVALIHSQTQELKRSGRVDGSEAVLRSASVLPGFLKDRAARLAASPRLYNLTVSNVPGPGAPLFAAGAMVEDVYPVIPLADEHLLAIGVLSYRDRLHVAAYADPGALPQVPELGRVFATALGELERAPRHGGPRRRSQRGSVGARIR
jgi:WS/DGAT/MGAT family acyltransferase